MKAVVHSAKTKGNSSPRSAKNRPVQRDLFLGYKALHELRILMRLASAPSLVLSTDSDSKKVSF